MTKAILWDNDGVLVLTEHLYFEATRRVLRSVGMDLTEAQYIELFLVQGRGAWHLAKDQGVPAQTIERLREERNALYGEWLAKGPQLVDGIVSTLEALHGKYVMGVVTSSRRDHFEVIHRSTGLLKYFDFVLTSDDYARTKPEPDPYVAAVERSGIARESCLAVEDSARGLTAAVRAGVRCVVVPTRLTSRSTFAGADRVLSSVTELPRVL